MIIKYDALHGTCRAKRFNLNKCKPELIDIIYGCFFGSKYAITITNCCLC